LSISSIMPVILPASSGWYLWMAGKSCSPIICFCTAGAAAARAVALRGPRGAAATAPCCCGGICWPGPAAGLPVPAGRGPICPMGIWPMGGRIMPPMAPKGPAMGPIPGIPIMPGPPLPGIMLGPPLPIMPIICGFIMGPRGPAIPRGYIAAACGGIMPIIAGGIIMPICGPPFPIIPPMFCAMPAWKP